MANAVRYFSKMGNTRKIADAIAEGADIKAVSITDESKLPEKVDILFLGGAPYTNVMDPKLRAYAEGISAEMVGKVVLFSTSAFSRRTIEGLKKILTEKGIEVEEKYFYASMTQVKNKLESARSFGRTMSNMLAH